LTYLAAELLVAFACALLVATTPVSLAPWMVAVWLLFGLPPALLAGPLAAGQATRRPPAIPPAVEAAARARFVPGQLQADTEAIRSADDGAREDEG
jgi:hypothetical protein